MAPFCGPTHGAASALVRVPEYENATSGVAIIACLTIAKTSKIIPLEIDLIVVSKCWEQNPFATKMQIYNYEKPQQHELGACQRPDDDC